jgi:mannose-6-phosphate isomerase
VLRGGLTTKHIDVHELIKHVKCEPTIPKILEGEMSGDAIVYSTPAPDFELSAYRLKKNDTVTIIADTADILLLVEGEARLKTNEASVTIKVGAPSAILFPAVPASLHAMEDTLLFRATVPVDK